MGTWTQADVDSLPDSCFLVVEDGGKKDSLGRTVPRSLRHFPYADKNGNVDLPHLRNALSRIPQSDLSTDVKDRATREAQRILDLETSSKKGAQAVAGDVIHFRGDVSIQAAAGDGAARQPRFSILANSGGPMSPAGYPNTVVDWSKADVSGDIPILAGHAEDLDSIAGQGTAAVRNGELHVEGALTDATTAGQKVLALSRAGIKLQASVGFAPGQRDRVPAGQTVNVNGRMLTAGPAGLTVVRSGRLREVSVLPVGADPNTQVTIAASAAHLKGKRSMADELNNDGIVDDAGRGLYAAEAGRVAAVETICARYGSTMGTAKVATIRAQAIKDGWDENRTELEFIRAARPSVSSYGGYHPVGGSPDILAAATLMLLGQEPVAEKCYAAPILEAARGARVQNTVDLLRAALAADFREVPAGGTDGLIRAAFTTASLPGILSNAMNKILLTQYQAVDSVAKKVAKKLTANDFKVHTGYRLTGDATLQPVGPNGELAHGTLAESAFPFSVGTFGRVYGITRQMMKNDDLSALSEIPAMIGRGSGLAIEKAFWTLVLANAGNFFGAGNNNYIDGATTVLGSAGLAQAVAAFRNQVDPQGNPILVNPKFLVVPTSLEEAAWELFKSTNIMIAAAGTTDAVTVRPTTNVYGGLFQPSVTPYLNNANIAGYSALAWYLFGDPGDVAAFGIAYLDGNEMPTIQDAPQPADVLGLGWRGYIDFGICQLDPRGGVKSKGAA